MEAVATLVFTLPRENVTFVWSPLKEPTIALAFPWWLSSWLYQEWTFRFFAMIWAPPATALWLPLRRAVGTFTTTVIPSMPNTAEWTIASAFTVPTASTVISPVPTLITGRLPVPLWLRNSLRLA